MPQLFFQCNSTYVLFMLKKLLASITGIGVRETTMPAPFLLSILNHPFDATVLTH